MDKSKWLVTLNPVAILQGLQGKRVRGRKWRLAAVAYCRQVWHLLTDERSRAAVEAAEQYADKLLTPANAMAIGEAAAAVVDATRVPGEDAGHDAAYAAAASLALWAQPDYGAMMAITSTKNIIGQKGQIDLLNCVFGIPYRERPTVPAWLTSTVVALARGIYAERAFDRLPILADALQDAGCDNPDVLAHCRGPGPHVRGCWAVDLILGKQ
jgi:hypothetical protein